MTAPKRPLADPLPAQPASVLLALFLIGVGLVAVDAIAPDQVVFLGLGCVTVVISSAGGLYLVLNARRPGAGG